MNIQKEGKNDFFGYKFTHHAHTQFIYRRRSAKIFACKITNCHFQSPTGTTQMPTKNSFMSSPQSQTINSIREFNRELTKRTSLFIFNGQIRFFFLRFLIEVNRMKERNHFVYCSSCAERERERIIWFEFHFLHPFLCTFNYYKYMYIHYCARQFGHKNYSRRISCVCP